VPPPPGRRPRPHADLLAFCDNDNAPAVAQAAIAHAQFETIHPFVDGNGRTGRALIHVILRRRGLTPTFVPPISLVLATHASDYVAGLTLTRYVGDPEGPGARDATNDWLEFFAAACLRAVADANAYEGGVIELQATWRQRLGTVRRRSATELLLMSPPGAPIVTVQSAAALIGRSTQATNEAVGRLTAAGILSQTTVGRRNRAFEAVALIDVFTALERQLASPEDDTRIAPPVRPVPPPTLKLRTLGACDQRCPASRWRWWRWFPRLRAHPRPRSANQATAQRIHHAAIIAATVSAAAMMARVNTTLSATAATPPR
jgi:hypothetical protein